ncbi:predicted protein [Arabidopsis lyrata subsp. lyrata]|uniref:Predicted protein n=1 Tax=Arabidopsis lyrata subsp. lyrata TaxID=81972 RepID=D7LVH2_ARALL|nr:predicted protein [Arabidopsis lyrata subsp. lyrata]
MTEAVATEAAGARNIPSPTPKSNENRANENRSENFHPNGESKTLPPKRKKASEQQQTLTEPQESRSNEEHHRSTN